MISESNEFRHNGNKITRQECWYCADLNFRKKEILTRNHKEETQIKIKKSRSSKTGNCKCSGTNQDLFISRCVLHSCS